MADESALPADPFGEVTSATENALWLHEQYMSLVGAGFTEEQAMVLTRDHLRCGLYWCDEDEE